MPCHAPFYAPPAAGVALGHFADAGLDITAVPAEPRAGTCGEGAGWRPPGAGGGGLARRRIDPGRASHGGTARRLRSPRAARSARGPRAGRATWTRARLPSVTG